MKVFICADKLYPRCNASSNYIECLALALLSQNIEVYLIVIKYVNSEERYIKSSWQEKNGVPYIQIPYCITSKGQTAMSRLSIGNQMWKQIQNIGICKKDAVIGYTINYFLMADIYKRAKKHGVSLSNCVVEWYLPRAFAKGIFDIEYWFDLLTFHFGIPIGKSVIPISRKLESYFKKRKCHTLLLPCLVNPYEFDYVKEKPEDILNFMYSGKAQNKDAMDVMLKAFLLLDGKELEKIHLYLAGSTENEIRRLSGLSEYDWHQLRAHLTILPWLDYEELIKTYQRMHFLLIARETSRTTLSNFPSKVPEMMAYGVIPVVSDVGDYTKYYLKDGYDSIQFAPCSAEHCAAAISSAIQLTKTEREKMQDRARRTAVNKFSYLEWGEKIKSYLENI